MSKAVIAGQEDAIELAAKAEAAKAEAAKAEAPKAEEPKAEEAKESSKKDKELVEVTSNSSQKEGEA